MDSRAPKGIRTPPTYRLLEKVPKITSNIVDCPDQEITSDMPVRVVFDDVTDEKTLPRFTPA